MKHFHFPFPCTLYGLVDLLSVVMDQAKHSKYEHDGQRNIDQHLLTEQEHQRREQDSHVTLMYSLL